MSIDTISDFLTIIRNGTKASKTSVTASYSQMREGIARILKYEGFIRGYSVRQDKPANSSITVDLKYVDGESVIHKIKRISKSSRREYAGYREFAPVIGGLGMSIVSTNKGLMTDKQAQSESLGGEVLCSVW